MAPQHPKFNRGIWKNLEDAVRVLDDKKEIFETYVICGPIFLFDTPIMTINPLNDKENTLPIPHAFFKSILTEDDKGRLHMWSFLIPNESTTKPLTDFQVPTRKVEKYAGFLLWERIVGKEIDKEKEKIRPMWKG
jgi:endonuclease G